MNKKLYLIPVLCDNVVGNFCIRNIDLGLRKPTDKEREFVERILKEKGYEWDRISIAVKQLYVKLPNGSLTPSSAMYWIVLEPKTEEKIYRAIILNFDSDNIEDINVRDVFVISSLDSLIN